MILEVIRVASPSGSLSPSWRFRW